MHVRKEDGSLLQCSVSGGRTWWAHFELTPINIEPTILRKKIEDLPEAGAWTSISTATTAVSPTTHFRLVSQIFTSWNRIGEWLRRLEDLRRAG